MKSKKSFKLLLKLTPFMLIASLMTGCVKPYVKPQLPANLKHCEPLPQFTGDSFGDVVTSYFELIHLYKDCNAKSNAKNSYFEEAP